jgi:hypothetical protein
MKLTHQHLFTLIILQINSNQINKTMTTISFQLTNFLFLTDRTYLIPKIPLYYTLIMKIMPTFS